MGTVETVVFLVGAGIVAGVVGTGGGVTSLISYPALLAAGVLPLPANIANLVAGVVTGPASALSSRPELTGAAPTLRRLIPATVLGTLAGAGLLTVTPPGVFARVVPFLVVAGSVVLLAQPALTRRSAGRVRRGGKLATVLVGVVSVYGGYFGAGSGVMLLAVVLILVDQRVPPANAVKNLLVGLTSIVAAAVFVGTGPVVWSVVLPLAAGMLVGSLLGPVVVRQVPPYVIRWAAAACGFVLAGYLWLRSG